MQPAIGWMHVKDYRYPPGTSRQQGHVDEDALKHFVPVDLGESNYDMILKEFRAQLPKLSQKLQRRGIPGVFLDLEPHLKGGGQFGGTSGPDGMGVALRRDARCWTICRSIITCTISTTSSWPAARSSVAAACAEAAS